jgi:hypothetical protein
MDITNIEPNPDQKTLDQHPTRGRCSACDWEGDLLDCDVETESESWERPDIIYTTFLCPQCNEEIDNFY